MYNSYIVVRIIGIPLSKRAILQYILKLWCFIHSTHQFHLGNFIKLRHSHQWLKIQMLLLLFGRVQLFLTPWTAACQASLSFTISRSFLKLMSSELVMPSNHLILCRPLLLLPSIFNSISVFSNEPALYIRWPKYWSFSFSISPSNEYSVFISLRFDWFDLLDVQGTLKSLLQHQLESTNSSALSLLYSPTLTCVHDYWKKHSFDYMDICQQSDVSASEYAV